MLSYFPIPLHTRQWAIVGAFSFFSFLLLHRGSRIGVMTDSTLQRSRARQIVYYQKRGAAHTIKKVNKMEEQQFKQVADLITARLDAIERYTLLGAKKVLTLDDVAILTGLSKSHLYKLTSAKQIPHYKPNTKSMYFDRAEIEEWMKQNRVHTQAEAEQQAINYVVGKGGLR